MSTSVQTTSTVSAVRAAPEAGDHKAEQASMDRTPAPNLPAYVMHG